MYNFNSGYGMLQAMALQNGITTLGKIFLVLPSSDANYMKWSELLKTDPDGEVRLFTTFEAAYAKVVTNRNDVIFLGGNGYHDVATGVAFSKSRVHVFGLDGGGRFIQQGSRIRLTGAVDCAYVMKETGTRNSFTNIKFIQESTHANALSVLQFGGEGSKYKNCSAVFGVVDNLDQTNAFEVINGADSYTFEDCTWGADTLLTSAARAVESLDIVTAGQECKSNIYKNQKYIISSSSSTATFIRTSAITDILFTNLWIDAVFQASVDSAGGAAIAEAVQTGTGVSKGRLNFVRPAVFGVTDFATATGGRNAGVQIVAAVSVAAAVEGITPTA